MIKISEKNLQEYIRLCKEVLNKDVDKQQALKESIKLINLFEALFKHKKN